MENYKNIKLEKDMYTVAGKSFSQVLEELDSSEKYKGTNVSEMDAFQRQLKRLNIKVSGNNSDMVSKFFTSSETATLFPEYINRAVISGMNEANQLSDIVATVTKIDAQDYRSITSSSQNTNFTNILEGSVIPETEIRTRQNLVNLQKHGRVLSASYESIKFQRIDLFTVILKQIGAFIAKSQMEQAINTLINGDGNSNPAQVISPINSGTIVYQDLLNLWSGFDPYSMNTILASPDMILKIAEMDEFKNPIAGINFAGTGQINSPMGAKVIKSDRVPSGTIIAIDKNCALEQIDSGSISLEYDKLIERQLERAAITMTTGFAKIFDDATKVLVI